MNYSPTLSTLMGQLNSLAFEMRVAQEDLKLAEDAIKDATILCTGRRINDALELYHGHCERAAFSAMDRYSKMADSVSQALHCVTARDQTNPNEIRKMLLGITGMPFPNGDKQEVPNG